MVTLLIAALALSFGGIVSAVLNVTSLQVETRTVPLGVDVVPRFSWITTSTDRGTVQRSYQIRVSTQSAGAADVWNSGVVSTSLSHNIVYAGPQLASDTTYFWAVDVTTNFGAASSSSTFSTGFFAVSDWGSSVWLSKPANTTTGGNNPVPLLRKEFNVDKPLAFARLYYAAGGYASLTLNGAAASDHVLTPGFTDYDQEVQYTVVDVRTRLQQGANAIGAELGRGRYGTTNPNVWNWETAPWHAEPTLRLVLSIGYTDGTRARVVSDGTWRVREGPTRLDDLFGGENYDANFAIPGYDRVGFPATGWVAPVINSGPRGRLLNEYQPPTRIIEVLSPVSITQPVQGIYIATFERNVAGWVRLSVTGPARTTVTIHYGERFFANGTVDTDSRGLFQNNFQTDRFTLAGTGQPELFEPKFSYKGYTHIQLEGWPGPAPTAANVRGVVVHDDLEVTGDIVTSNDLLNRMHRASVRTLLNNAHSIPQDCPTYEKNGWAGDAMVSAEMFLTNLNTHNFLAKYTRDLDQSRANGNGPPAVIAPDSGWGLTHFTPALTWNSAFIFVPWWLYEHRGDRRILEEHYTSMRSYAAFELNRSPNNIARTVLGDWVNPETSPNGGNAPEDTDLTATAFLYRILTTTRDIASVLGRTADVTTLTTQANNVKSAFNAAFFNSTSGTYVGRSNRDRGYRQTHNLLAIAFNLTTSAASTTRVAQSLAADVVAKGNHLNTGALGTKWLLPVLSDTGQLDAAFNVAVQTTFPSWGFWIQNGATTMWEHWALASRSRDHHFLGTFEDWLYKHVAGIKPLSPGYASVSIAPLFTSRLTTFTGFTTTPFGRITVDWRNAGGTLTINVDIPVSVNATITLPRASTLTTFNGQRSSDVVTEGEDAKLNVGSGQHTLVLSSK